MANGFSWFFQPGTYVRGSGLFKAIQNDQHLVLEMVVAMSSNEFTLAPAPSRTGAPPCRP